MSRSIPAALGRRPARRRWALWPGLAGLIGLTAALGATCAAGESPSKPTPPPGPTVATPPAAESEGMAAPTEADVEATRAELGARLKPPAPSAAGATKDAAPPGGAATPAAAPAASAPETSADKALRELLQERLGLLDEYDKAAREFRKASHPEPSPEKQGEEARADLARLQSLLNQAASNPDVLLPPAFRVSAPGLKPAVSSEMKEAIEAATGECQESRAKLEALRTEAASREAQQNARRAERDKLFQAVLASKPRPAERDEAAVGTSKATTTAANGATQRLAKERQANALWKSRVAAMRLRAAEAGIALEAKLAGVRELGLQVARARAQLDERTLGLMQSRYSEAAERQERALKARAAAEESAASRADDPLERYRARRQSELLALEALVVQHEQALATSPRPSPEEQSNLADRAADDFARVKRLLDDGRVSRLDAIRLNNDFRRIGPERERLLRNEMAIAEARLQYYEDALTNVELELLQDTLQDRYELELLKESLPPSRRDEGARLLAELEQIHRALLVRRREVLERLGDNASRALEQIARRLAILDEEYAFIRTHIFWVRDQDPIGSGTLAQGARECRHLLRALGRLAREACRRREWGRPSPEFLASALAAVGLPIGLVRLRRLVRHRIALDLPGAGGGPGSEHGHRVCERIDPRFQIPDSK